LLPESDPDPLVRATDLHSRIRTKKSRMPNTASTFAIVRLAGQRAQVRYAFPGELREGQPPVRAGLQPLQGRPD
jgi:hypothetical protein